MKPRKLSLLAGLTLGWLISIVTTAGLGQELPDRDGNAAIPLQKRITLSDGVPPSLGSTARKVLRALLDNDPRSFAASCSNNGLIVVNRSWEPDMRPRSTEPPSLKQPPPHSNGMVAFNWFDQQERFDQGELAGDEFKRLFKEFGVPMSDSYGKIDVSTSMWDVWGCRYLGPAISAKVASGEYLYFYLVKQRQAWRVWRLELAVH